MLEDLLKEHGADLLSAMTSGSELDAGQAEQLLPPALSGIGDAVTGGGLDLGDLLGGGEGAVGALLSKLDLGQIAGAAGLSEGQTQSGLQSLLPVVLSLLGDKAGGAEGLLSMLGGVSSGGSEGGLGALVGAAGKLFGK